MSETPDQKLLWFNFLKILTRALVQINLYKPDHPQVKLALEEGQALLRQISDALGGGDFSLTLDTDKLLVNGVQLITADKLPNSLKNLFSKFRIQTITFAKGASGGDLLALCQMQAHKGEAKAFLKERGIERITLNESVYSKVDASDGPQTAPAPAQAVSAPTLAVLAPVREPAEKIAEKISAQGLETAIATVVGRVTSDPAEQRRIMDIFIAKFKEEMEKEVKKALVEVHHEKKKVENDMARMESVMTSMADGVVVVDKEGRILMMNPQAEAISGRPLSELSGKKIMDLSELESQVVSLAKEIRSENKDDISKEMENLRPSALADTVKKATAIIQNEEGKIVGSVSIPTYTVKLKQVEQLQQDFIANMTHELRSPLTSIKAALDMISRDTSKDDSSRGVLNTAIRNAERLNSIITDILDFSKLQSGKLVFHPEETSAEEIAKEAADAMRVWANTKSLDLSVITEPGLPRIYADKRRTVQVLINLISNSIKFTPQAGTIEISADAGKDSLSDFVFFSVKDSGCGIKKEDQAKVFEKFVQVAAGEKVGGTGLGLAITKAMVVMQNGRISLESDPGRGSTFRVGMPLYKSQTEQPVFEQLPEMVEEDKSWWKKLLRK